MQDACYKSLYDFKRASAAQGDVALNLTEASATGVATAKLVGGKVAARPGWLLPNLALPPTAGRLNCVYRPGLIAYELIEHEDTRGRGDCAVEPMEQRLDSARGKHRTDPKSSSKVANVAAVQVSAGTWP